MKHYMPDEKEKIVKEYLENKITIKAHIESLWNIFKKEALDKPEYTFDEFKYQTNLYFNWYNLERLTI